MIDPVTLTIISNSFVNICREMGITMMRTAFSPIFNEGLDFSCVMFDRDANVIGQGEFCPAQIAAAIFAGRWTVEELGVDAFEPGDVVLHNDPYRGGTHMPEHLLLRPVFYEGELFGFLANIGHLAEIGGKAVGGFAADATEIFQEGLRIPPVKIVKRDEHDMELWRLIMTNHRTPRNTWGDINAQIGSLRVAERSTIALLDRYGRELVEQAARELIDYSERWMRSEIAAIPDGSYSFTGQQEDDGITDEPVTYHVEVTVDGEQLVVDWTGTDPQTRGPINATYGVIAGAVYNAIFHLTNANIPKNAGAYRPIRIIAPPGSAVNVVYPRPCVAGNTESHPKLADMVIAALAPALPDRVAAARGRHGVQLPLRRHPPEDRRVLRELPPRGGRLGSDLLRRRKQRHHRQERELPEHPGRDLRDSLSAEDARVFADPRLGRGGDDARRARHQADHARHGGRRDHRQRRARPDKARIRRVGPRGRRARGAGSDPGQAPRRHRIPDVLGGLRHRLALEVHERDLSRATRC